MKYRKILIKYNTNFKKAVFHSREKIIRGYSNVFVKYVFYFMSEVDNIYIS